MLEKIKPSHIVYAVLALGVLPIFFVVCNFVNKQGSLSQSKEKLSLVRTFLESKYKKQLSNTEILSKHREIEPFYIDQKLESHKISFVENAIDKNKYFQETLISMSSPVEVDEEELQEILVNAEGVTIGDLTPPQKRPHLIITEFSLQKQPDLFVLNMQILQRLYYGEKEQ